MTDAELTPALWSASNTPDGDATPLGSISRRSGANCFTMRWIVVMRSNLRVQQTHPLGSSTDSMPPAENISPSIPAAPKSFTSTTVFSIPCFTKLRMNVVLPDPNNPHTIVVFMPDLSSYDFTSYPITAREVP